MANIACRSGLMSAKSIPSLTDGFDESSDAVPSLQVGQSKETTMSLPRIVSSEEWRAARVALLEEERRR